MNVWSRRTGSSWWWRHCFWLRLQTRPFGHSRRRQRDVTSAAQHRLISASVKPRNFLVVVEDLPGKQVGQKVGITRAGLEGCQRGWVVLLRPGIRFGSPVVVGWSGVRAIAALLMLLPCHRYELLVIMLSLLLLLLLFVTDPRCGSLTKMRCSRSR